MAGGITGYNFEIAQPGVDQDLMVETMATDAAAQLTRLEESFTTLDSNDPAALMKANLEMNKANQTVQLTSGITKSMHEMATGVIRNMS